MTQYRYTAVNKEGSTIEGVAEAANKEALITNLNKQSLKPIVIKVSSTRRGLRKFIPNKKVKLHDLVIFTRQLSTMVSAGVPLARSLSTLQVQTENSYFKTVIGGITKDVESGLSLGEAFAKYPRVFSDVYVNMVKAGETGGILDEILKRLAGQIEQDSSIRKKVKSAMMYPTVILSITVVAFFGIMIFVIPKIAKIMKDLGGPNAQLPVYTRIMLGISDFMRGHAIILIVVIVVLVWGTTRYIRTPKGKYQFHALLLRIPVIKTIVIKVAISRFARTFSSLMSAGVNVLDALEVTGGSIGNKVIEAELRAAAKQVKNGKQLSEPLSTSPHFPPIVSQMIAVGEETGKLDTILIKVADFYEEEVETLVDGLSSIIEPLMIVILGSIVGFIAASVMGPIANLSKNIGNQ